MEDFSLDDLQVIKACVMDTIKSIENNIGGHGNNNIMLEGSYQRSYDTVTTHALIDYRQTLRRVHFALEKAIED